MIDILFTCEF